MSRWIKIALKVSGILLALVALGWMAIAAYVHTHKKELLASLTEQLNQNLSGTLKIEKMEPALIRGFPGISVSLTNVLLRDSLWDQHKHDVLSAKEAFVSVDAFSILTGSPTIKNITINKGNLYFFTDSMGYSNTDFFNKKKAGEKPGEGNEKKINRIDLHDVNMVLENHLKDKYLNFSISRFSGKIRYNSEGWEGTAKINTVVKSLAFNTARGSFIQNKSVQANLDLNFNDQTKLLTIPLQDIKIGDDHFEAGGKFSLAKDKSDFALDIKTPSITFTNASALLLPKISAKLKRYELEKPFSVDASIRGKLKSGEDPFITSNWKVDNNTMTVDGETVTDVSFTGKFTNEIIKGDGLKDKNSQISLFGMKGKWHDIPFSADSITITDLKNPILAGQFLANFPLRKLNKVFGGETFSFSQGTADLNLKYKAPYFSKDQSQRYINGKIEVKDASLKYLPRNLPFTNVKARLDFSGQDLFMRNTNVQSGGSSMQMEGSIRNFLNLFYTDPEKIKLDWHIESPQINLSQFLSFLGRRKGSKSYNTKNINRFSGQLDRMLNEASVHMQMHVKKVIYKKFIAQNVKSNLTLNQQGININDISVGHAGGSLKINGNIDQRGKLNKVKLNTKIRDANIQELFYAFNNFGQDGITDRNLRGTFNADCNISGTMRDNGDMVPRSIRGTVFFDLKNGALIDFEPLKKVGDFAFANRDFSNITFKNLSNTLIFEGNSVTIPPMKIESSVLNIFLQGVYGFTWGTNISMQVPLRNPKKDEFVLDKVEKEIRSKKGIVINLHAVDGEDGKVKIKLGKDKLK